jgi:ABC-type transport system involved in multi-copper enzyme maturation permease subunit
MTNLTRLEFLKLRTTPAFYVTAAAALVLSIISASTSVLIKPHGGAPPLGSASNVQHVLSQPSAVTSMAMFILGILVVAGEYRQRTILGTFLAEPRRLRVITAKLLAVGVTGVVIAAITYAVTSAVAISLYADKGVHHVPVDIAHIGVGTVLSAATYGLLGVAVGALTRNTVAAIIGGLIWFQVFEVAILENAVPSLAKWFPVGASQGLTSLDTSRFLPPAGAAAVLVGWAAVLVLAAARLSIRRELR